MFETAGRPLRFFIKTIGCQMNLADSENAAAHLSGLGMLPAVSREEADVIFVNTCTVRRDTELDALAYIGRLGLLKESKPELKLIVAGCAAQQWGDDLRKKFPFVDLVVGAKDIGRFPGLFAAAFGQTLGGTGEVVPSEDASPVTAFVTIMRGCGNFCSYCIVPYVRGPEVSRPVEEVLEEVRGLVRRGVKEVTLLGQNVNSYAGSLPDGTLADLSCLLRAVSEVDGLLRVRFTTNHPKDLSDTLIRTLATAEKLCPHVHLPLQSGSDRVLRAMNRRYTADGYLRLVERLRSAVPEVALTTDILVGFPGETEEEFRETLRLVEQIGFDSLFTYKYSPREGTPAFALADDVPQLLKEERHAAILAAAQRSSEERHRRFMGTVQEVLVEKKEDRFCTGRTGGNTKVYFFGDAARIVPGSLVPVRITESRITTLVGEVLPA